MQNVIEKAFVATSDALNPVNKLIREATPDTSGQVAYFIQQQVVEQSYQSADPGRDQLKFLTQRIETGGAFTVAKSLQLVRALIQDGAPNFTALLKFSTHALVNVATADTRRDSVEEANKLTAQQILASIGQPVAGAAAQKPSPYSETATQGKTPWQEMQEQQARETKRREKDAKSAKERALAERAEELRREAVTFDIKGTPAKQIVDKIVGGTRKKVPQSELTAFSNALAVRTGSSDEVMKELAKRLLDDAMATRMKVLEALVQLVRDERLGIGEAAMKYQRRLCSIRDAKGGVGLEKKTQHCADLAVEILQTAEGLRERDRAEVEQPMKPNSDMFAFARSGSAVLNASFSSTPTGRQQQQQQPPAAAPANHQQPQLPGDESPFSSMLGGGGGGGSAANGASVGSAASLGSSQTAAGGVAAQLQALQQQQQMLMQLQAQAQQKDKDQQQQQQREAQQAQQLAALQAQQQQLRELQDAAAEKAREQGQRQQQEQQLAALLAQQKQLQDLQAQQEAAKLAAAAQAERQRSELLQAQRLQEEQAKLRALQEQQQQQAELQRQQELAGKSAQHEELQKQLRLLQEQQTKLQALQQQQQQQQQPPLHHHQQHQQQQQPQQQPQHAPASATLDSIFGMDPIAPASVTPSASTLTPSQRPLNSEPFDPFSMLMDPAAQAPAPRRQQSTHLPPAQVNSQSPMRSMNEMSGDSEIEGVVVRKITEAQRALKQMQPIYNNLKGLPELTPLPQFV
ncbi:hypothetical protein DIPPA_35136 [Diplonema papillatum]|nr:hypothetical protein DIPPA_35136 [Diplonema papillatum]